jgi:hypothetical protein
VYAILASIALLLTIVAPAGAVGGPLLSFTSPATERVDVAMDAACAVEGACDLTTSLCTSGMIGMACQTATDCAGRINTCRIVVTPSSADALSIAARLDGKLVAGFAPASPGVPLVVDVQLDPRRRHNRLRIKARGMVSGRMTKQDDMFRFSAVPEIRYRPLPARFGVPASAERLDTLITSANDRAIRQHAWQIWAGLTARTPERFNGRRLPVFETWFSGAELYDPRPYACEDVLRRAFDRDFERPSQFIHGGALPNEQVTGFNRFNREVVQHVCERSYNQASVLDALNASFGTDTAIGARDIDPFPRAAVALKPVFTTVAQSGLTILPYWAGPTASSNLVNPTPDTWTQCVAVVPPGTDAPSSPTSCTCNGIPDYPCEVVPLKRFYAFPLTADEVAEMSNDASLVGTGVVPGDYAVLVAMHVTTKETPRWAWQTFWWSPTPNASPAGDDRIAGVKREFRNYVMCTAWTMNGPPESLTGTPQVCFNPYLETGLPGIDGVQSNCMTCHQMAAWPNFSTNYQANGFVSPDDPLFGASLKLDFLWSVTRAQ